MKVIAYYKNVTKYILVLGELKKENELEDFLFEISGTHPKLEIMFIESLILPVRIIEALVSLLEQYSRETLTIYTMTTTLSQYLFDLNIPNTQLKTWKSINLEEAPEKSIIFSEDKLYDLLARIYDSYGYDFRNYQLESLKRTFARTMAQEKIPDLDYFQQKILQDPELFQRLFLDLSINVTSYFRYPELFKVLREEVFPYLNSFPHLRIWSVGAASGEEAYSIAILLNELKMLEKSTIYATDFNSLVLQKAQNGLYSLAVVKQAVNNYDLVGGEKELESYFKINAYYAQIEPSIKKKVVFFQHNLTADGVFNEFHLIVCKNVLIYFNSRLREDVTHLFKMSLHRNGFLVLGRSENLFNSSDFKRFKLGFNIFKPSFTDS